MRTLYLDCGMGAAGDMLCAALLELLPDSERFVSQFNTLGIPGVEMIAEPSVKCGFHGTHVSMRIRGQEEDSAAHAHSRPGEIQTLIEGLSLPDVVKEDVLAVYASLAEAESKVPEYP